MGHFSILRWAPMCAKASKMQPGVEGCRQTPFCCEKAFLWAARSPGRHSAPEPQHCGQV